MARPKARYPRGCIVCKSTRPRSEWKPHKGLGRCDTHYRQLLRALPMCKYDGCKVRLGVKPKDSRQGYCRRHDHLLLHEPHRTADAIEKTRNKFASQIKGDPVTGCWNWVGRTNGKYALISVGNHDWLAHRYSFGQFIGGHEPRLTLDHACRNRFCVRPDHLMPMTLLANTRKEHDGKELTPDDIARTLLLIPHMPLNVAAWAMMKGLPIGRATPGEHFAFGTDGQPFEHTMGVSEYPPATALSRV